MWLIVHHGHDDEGLSKALGDVNNDQAVDVDDVVAVVNIILNSGQQNAHEMMEL